MSRGSILRLAFLYSSPNENNYSLISNKLKEHDNLRFNFFRSVEEFIVGQQVRVTEFHRIIIVDSVFDTLTGGLANTDALYHFYSFLASTYPETPTILFSKKKEVVEGFSQIFVGVNFLHVHNESFKPPLISDLAVGDFDKLKSVMQYTSSVVDTSDEDMSSNSNNTRPNQKVKGKDKKLDSDKGDKKGGIFGRLFGRKGKSKVTPQPQVDKNPVVQENVSPQLDGAFDDPSSFGDTWSEVQISDDGVQTPSWDEPLFATEQGQGEGFTNFDDWVGESTEPTTIGDTMEETKVEIWGKSSEDDWGTNEGSNESMNGSNESWEIGSDDWGTPENQEVLSDHDSYENEGDMDNWGLSGDSTSSDFGGLNTDTEGFENEGVTSNKESGFFEEQSQSASFPVSYSNEDSYESDNENNRGDLDDSFDDWVESDDVESSNQESNDNVGSQPHYIESNVSATEELGNSETCVTVEESEVTSETTSSQSWSHYGREEDVIEDTSSSTIAEIRENVKKLATLPESVAPTSIPSVPSIDAPSIPVIPQVAPVSSATSESDLSDDLDITQLQQEEERYHREKNATVIEKLVEVKEVVERVVDRVGRDRSTTRYLVVTGDRRSGVTTTAMQLAKLYAPTNTVLYVDMDTNRRGSLLFFGIPNIVKQPTVVQNGLSSVQTAQGLTSAVYRNVKHGFDALVSIYGTEIVDSQIKKVFDILLAQRQYNTVIIDCPIENLGFLEDVIPYADILICSETDISGTMALVLRLASSFANVRTESAFIKNSGFYLAKSQDENRHFANMKYISDLFSLDKSDSDWTSIAFFGKAGQLKEIAEKLY